LVDISKTGLEQMGVTVNISRRGMCIATTEILRRRSRLQILVAAVDDVYAITGIVVWNLRKRVLLGEDAPAEIGIHIEKAASGYYKFVAAVRRNSLPAPKNRLAC